MESQKVTTDNTMPPDVRDRVFMLRCRSKSGGGLTPEELKYLEGILKKWPKCYAAMNSEIFKATKPFGSR